MYDLSTIVEILGRARKAGKAISKQVFANACTRSGEGSTKSGIFNHKLAAFRHFNLIETAGDNISFTTLTDKVLEKAPNSLKIAFRAPDTFLYMYETLEHNSPLEIGLLEQIAHLQAGISEVGKERFVKNFVESGVYAGMIRYSLGSKREVVLLDEDRVEATPEKDESLPAPGENTQKAELKTSKGKAVIVVPEELSDEDRKRLKSQIDLF